MRKLFLLLTLLVVSISVLGCSQEETSFEEGVSPHPYEDEGIASTPLSEEKEEENNTEAISESNLDASIQSNGYSYSIDSDWETRPLKEGANASYYLLEGSIEEPLVSLLILESVPTQECIASEEQIDYMKSLITSSNASQSTIAESYIGEYGCIEYQVNTHNQVQYLASFFVDPNYFVKIIVAGEADLVKEHEDLVKEMLATIVLSEFDESLISSE